MAENKTAMIVQNIFTKGNYDNWCYYIKGLLNFDVLQL